MSESLDALTPREIVDRLDRHVIGQTGAKRAIAVAIRNRWRRRQLDEEARREVLPKNILMAGPTGVGKTEIARRVAQMIRAPFLKVEATKYTEVGYQGRDVESMIRDLVRISIAQVRAELAAGIEAEARAAAEERTLELLVPPGEEAVDREALRADLRAGRLAGRMVEISGPAVAPVAGLFGALGGGEDVGLEVQEMMAKMLPPRHRVRRVSLAEALRWFLQEETEKRVDEEAMTREGVERAEQGGIVFIDEIDKVIGTARSDGPDVSREGVQRDLLPLVEGASVATRWGLVRTDHILFIAAGAFHGRDPSELIPEFQGRFPIRVELQPLGRAEFEQILVRPRSCLLGQYERLLAAEGVGLVFEPDAVAALAEFAARANASGQDLGARRLHGLMERLLEPVLFDAPEMRGRTVRFDGLRVRQQLAGAGSGK